jgi:hypothetical protein
MLRQKIKRRVKILWSIGAAVAFLFSAICTFLGVAPGDAIQFIFGHELVGRLLDLRTRVLGMTGGQARLLLVVSGDLLFAIGLYYVFYIHFATKMERLYVTYGDLDVLKEMAQKLVALSAKADTFEKKVADTARRERTIRTLHDMTAKMLKEIRKRKTE